MWHSWSEKFHDDLIKWKYFARNWPFVRGMPRLPVNSPHEGEWRGSLMFPLICAWINGWLNNRGAGDLRRDRGHYDVTVMFPIRTQYMTTKLIWLNINILSDINKACRKKRYIDKGGNMRIYKENVSFTWFNSVDPSGSAMPIHVICNDVHTIFSTCHHVSLLIIVIIYHPLYCDMVTFCWNGKVVGVCVREVHYTWFHVK